MNFPRFSNKNEKMQFDDIDTLQYVSPRLSSVNNNVEVVAKEALNLLR